MPEALFHGVLDHGAGTGGRTPMTRRSADFESQPALILSAPFITFTGACEFLAFYLVRFGDVISHPVGQSLGRETAPVWHLL